MADTSKPLLIKRYASRRLYNTETSDYVTLEDIATFIRDGREVQIVDLKSGDDLTRQYLLQIIAELVYGSNAWDALSTACLGLIWFLLCGYFLAVVNDFRSNASQLVRRRASRLWAGIVVYASWAAFFKAMTGGMMGATAPKETDTAADDLDTIKQQLAAMQEKLSKMGK